MTTQIKVVIIGAGLAGSECAWYLAQKGISVVLLESKRVAPNPAQKSQNFAELVCTNSLKSKDPSSAHGLLKVEMQALGSLVIESAFLEAVPAGDALAVDREKFSKLITCKLMQHPLIQIVDKEVSDPLWEKKYYDAQYVVVASGPLTSPGLELWLRENLLKDDLYFYDAIAPIVDAETLDYSKLYFKDRHKDPVESADYLNAPMNKVEYENFMDALVQAEKVKPKDFEKEAFFESCLPIDVMAERGKDTARFSCMKPIGLFWDNLPAAQRPYAVVQMRKENLLGSAFNLVGFQTRLTYPEQKRIFRMIPGLEQAEFIHLGSVHRNTYLNSAKHLSADFEALEMPGLFFAGQIVGVEGYTESAAMGLYVAAQIEQKIRSKITTPWPVSTAMGALVNYVRTWQKPVPSNFNFGLLPAVELDAKQRKEDKKSWRKKLAAIRAQEQFKLVMDQLS